MEWQKVVLQVLKNQSVILRALYDSPLQPMTKARILTHEAETNVLIDRVQGNLRIGEVR